MLFIQALAPEAQWAEQGWPAAMPAGKVRPVELELLGWAMRTVAPATRARDWPAAEDLVDEGSVWLARVRVNSYATPDRALQRFLSIADSLWSEVQRAVGARESDRLVYATRLMSKLCGVTDFVGPRPEQAVPTYVPPAERPHLGGAGSSSPSAASQLLTDLSTALSDHRGHLVDVADHRRPPADTRLKAMGWRSRLEPQGPPLGSLDASEATLRLRAQVTTDVLSTAGNPGRILAAAWLIDTTLVVTPQGIDRVAGVVDTWWDQSEPELIWRLPDVLSGSADPEEDSRRR